MHKPDYAHHLTIVVLRLYSLPTPIPARAESKTIERSVVMAELTEAQRLEAVRQVLYLDADYGYSVHIVVWPVEKNGDNADDWIEDYTLHREELTPETGPRNMRNFVKFLDKYKRQPLSKGIVKRRERRESDTSEAKL